MEPDGRAGHASVRSVRSNGGEADSGASAGSASKQAQQHAPTSLRSIAFISAGRVWQVIMSAPPYGVRASVAPSDPSGAGLAGSDVVPSVRAVVGPRVACQNATRHSGARLTRGSQSQRRSRRHLGRAAVTPLANAPVWPDTRGLRTPKSEKKTAREREREREKERDCPCICRGVAVSLPTMHMKL